MKKITATLFVAACLLSNADAMQQQGQNIHNNEMPQDRFFQVDAEKYAVSYNNEVLLTIYTDPTSHCCVLDEGLDGGAVASIIVLQNDVILDYSMTRNEKIAALREAYGNQVQIDVRETRWRVWRRGNA